MIEIAVLGAVIAQLTESFFAVLATQAKDRVSGSAIDAILTAVKRDPAKREFKSALTSAIRRYVTSAAYREDLIRPVLDSRALLTDPHVTAELAKIFGYGEKPDASVVAASWASVLADGTTADLIPEAEALIALLREQLLSSATFRPLFDSIELHDIGSHLETSVEVLTDVEQQLESLVSLVAGEFAELRRCYARSALGVRSHIRDVSVLIDDRTREFVGRQSVFNEIDSFVTSKRNTSGYFFLKGKPGIGKSAVAAKLVKNRGYPHHFNVQAERINTAAAFLSNMSSQLIARYDLYHDVLPARATQDSGFFGEILNEVSAVVSRAATPAVLIVDALDEADPTDLDWGNNPLLLPRLLPPGIFIIVTTRDEPLSFSADVERLERVLDPDSDENRADIVSYLKLVANGSMRDYLAANRIERSRFVDHLAQSSEGNFMYLRYVLPELERGTYEGITVSSLPVGLEAYYEDHWRRMKGRDRSTWREYKLPVLMQLAVAGEPISAPLLSRLSGIEIPRVRDALREWRPFLRATTAESDGRVVPLFAIYHTSFLDFLGKKEELQEEGVSQAVSTREGNERLFEGFFDEPS